MYTTDNTSKHLIPYQRLTLQFYLTITTMDGYIAK